MRWWLGLCLSITLAVGSGGPARAQPAGQAADQVGGLADSLDPLLDDPRLAGLTIGVAVRSAATGALLYDRGGAQRMAPGSNEKLLTTTAALARLGPAYRFRTRVLADAPPRDGVVSGTLYLRGEGDPSLRPSRLEDLAAATAAAGVTSVRGGLVADDSFFDQVRLGTDWSWQDETFAYAAPISALSLAPDADLNTGSVQVDILPGASAGAPAQVGLQPPTGVLQLEAHVLTGPPGSPRQLSGQREHGTNRLVVAGTMPLDGRPAHPLFSVDDPTGYAADVFAAALARHGVRLGERAVRQAPTPAGAVELAALDSLPLGELLVPLLKLSNNPMAEMLTKTLGRRDADQGTWDAGLAVVRRFVATEGVDPAQVQLVDGSGLSTSDLIAPDDLTALLVAVQSEPWFALWYAALPVAGDAEHLVGGTLATRMQDTPAAGNVHAKTGTLATTSALSGYVTTAAGERLVFSIMDGGFVGAPPRQLEDAIAVSLASVPACLVACDAPDAAG